MVTLQFKFSWGMLCCLWPNCRQYWLLIGLIIIRIRFLTPRQTHPHHTQDYQCHQQRAPLIAFTLLAAEEQRQQAQRGEQRADGVSGYVAVAAQVGAGVDEAAAARIEVLPIPNIQQTGGCVHQANET
jgi:hypothetical protein